MTELAKSFEPAAIEARWAPRFEQPSISAPTLDAARPSFRIHLPPPTVTGTRPMGPALNHTLMDSLTPYHRTRGPHNPVVPGRAHTRSM